MKRVIFAGFLLLALFASPGSACKDGFPAEALAPDESGGAVDRGGCATITCGPPPPLPCTTINGNSPFIRHPAIATGPLAPGVGCFAVARNANDYHLLFNTEGGSLRYHESTDGLTWTDKGFGLWLMPIWASGVQCPDPHFINTNGSMVMYMSAHQTAAAGGSIVVARATSANNGQNWTMNNVPLVNPTATHFPYMPSAVPVPGGWLLAYAWICNGSLTEGATIDVLFSADGVTNWQPRAVPAIATSACDTWDDGSVNRPRLLVDPLDATGNTIHMFYSGYEWDGVSVPTRRCGRIGRAVSTDGGFTWIKNSRPVFEPDPGNWNNLHVLKPSLVFERCRSGAYSILRLYYEARGSYPPGTPQIVGLGVAEAPWPFGSTLCPTVPLALGEEDAGDIDPPGSSIARVTSAPNPTRGTTSIGVDLSNVAMKGEAELTIVDVTGRLVRRVWSGPAESHPTQIEWDGRSSDGTRVAPGRYLARVRVAGESVGKHWITLIQ